MMTLKDAIKFALDEYGVTRYAIAKKIGVEPIVIDKILQEKQKTLNKVCCRLLQENYSVEVDWEYVNMETASFRQADKLLDFGLIYVYKDNNVLPFTVE